MFIPELEYVAIALYCKLEVRLTDKQSFPGSDLRSGHLCNGRRGPCHMVLGGP